MVQRCVSPPSGSKLCSPGDSPRTRRAHGESERAVFGPSRADDQTRGRLRAALRGRSARDDDDDGNARRRVSLAPRQPGGCHRDRVAADSYRGDAASVGSREKGSAEGENEIVRLAGSRKK